MPDKFRDVEKDTTFIRQSENCPRDEVIADLEQILESGPDDYEMRFKVTYLFIKLHYDKERNRKALLDIFNSYPYEKSERVNIEPERAMDMVADCINQGEFDDLIPHVLDLKTDNAVATIYYGSLTTLLKRAPERFLKSLSKRSERKRHDLYSSMCMATPKQELAEALSNVDMSSDLYPVFVEMRNFFSRDARCSRL